MKLPLLALFSILSFPLALPAHAIVNGRVAPNGSLINKATVMVRTGVGLCSGTLLANDIVITAAHCLKGIGGGITVHFGVQGERGERPVTRFRSNPGYRGDWANDMAILRFAGGAPRGSSPVAALDESPGNIPAGRTIIAAGYGDTQANVGETDTLRYAPLEIIGTRGDQVLLRGRGTSTCFGDSGGPAFLEHEGEMILFGVVSGSLTTSQSCGGTLVFNRLDAHGDWIANTIKDLRR